MFIVSQILEALTGNSEPTPYPFERPYKFVRRFRKWEMKHYRTRIWQMEKIGLVKTSTKGGQKFIQCTKKGQLYILFEKAILPQKKPWDHSWRIITFDIPESSKDKRHTIRFLLRKNNFIKLQASVYISPYQLNRQAIRYLKETGLKDYIRILRVSEIDDDSDLKKKFKL